MTTVLLVRHGESLSNLGLATTATAAVSISFEGVKQAEEVAQQLKVHPKPDLIVHSPYLRAKQTAQPTIKAFPYIPVEQWPVQEFTYLSSWRDELTTIEQRRPVVEVYWELSDPNLIDGPECESFKGFIDRVRDIKKRVTG
jgi:probable phosphoglycerate mutase